jgi:uncharacterized membrane protein
MKAALIAVLAEMALSIRNKKHRYLLALLAAGLAYTIGDTANMAVEAYQHQHPKVGARVFCGLVANASELLYEKIKITGETRDQAIAEVAKDEPFFEARELLYFVKDLDYTKSTSKAEFAGEQFGHCLAIMEPTK